MKWTLPLVVVGVLLAIGGSYAIWYAVTYPFCANSGQCTPNIFIGIPGLLIGLVGVSMIGYVWRRG